jgi:hypothetical protein
MEENKSVNTSNEGTTGIVKKTYTDPITGKFVKGNPGGTKAPGTKNFTTKVKEALLKIADGKDYTYEEAFIKAIMKKAIVDKDVGMMRTVWEQLDGKPVQRIGNIQGEEFRTNDVVSDKELDKILEQYAKRKKESDTSETL